jgi:hypothetical protein
MKYKCWKLIERIIIRGAEYKLDNFRYGKNFRKFISVVIDNLLKHYRRVNIVINKNSGLRL